MAGKARTQRKTAKHVVTSDNDNYSFAVDDLVPPHYTGTERYLDVIQWNLEWFGAAKSTTWDRKRWALVVGILARLNADLFVFQEVAGPTERRPGALDAVAAELTAGGAGDYAVDYTKAGGEQRVAMMWDRDWLRAKADVAELFERGAHQPAGGPDPFAGRTPLYGWFTGRLAGGPNSAPGGSFDFQVLGVHLKAMADGAGQRQQSARVLSAWMEHKAPLVDADVLIMGDFNAPPDDACWAPFHALEDARKAAFRAINDPSDFSYLWLRNKKDKALSRIDLTVASLASMTNVAARTVAAAVRWKPIEEVIAQTQDLTGARATKLLEQLKSSISDHLPTFSRFYFTAPERSPRRHA